MYNSCINIFAWQRSLNIEFTTIVYCTRNCWPGLLIQQRLLEVISKHRKYHLTEVISKHKMTILWKFCMKFSHLCVVYQLRKEKKNSLHRPGSVRLFDFLPKHGCTSLLKNQNPPAQHHNYILSSWGENKACPGGIVSHNEAKKVHRFRKETLGATHDYLKCLQRIEYNYVSQASWKLQDLIKTLISWNKVSIILHITRTSSTVFLHPHLACAAT